MAHPNFLLNSSTLVVGGSSGIGFAVASAALSSGSKVHITSTTAEKLSAKSSQLRSLYPGAHVSGSAANLSSTETLEANLKSVLDGAVKETGGALDHIVYTAGDDLDRTSLADMTAVLALSPFTVRYLGPLLIAKHIAANPGKYLKATHTSSITLSSGTLSHRPHKGIVSTGVTGAVEVLSRTLAVELAPIRVNVVIPGAVRTELLDKLSGGNSDVFKEASLTKQVGTPEGAAEAYLFCMRSALATGQGFIVDNGSLMV
ncbi:short chain dehydrogenase [Mycena haematopus]|nr:short chain dehydrogenase [Mycena haematopus]